MNIFKRVEVPEDANKPIEEQIFESCCATIVELGVSLGWPLRISREISVLLCLQVAIQPKSQVFHFRLGSPSIRRALFSQIVFPKLLLYFELVILRQESCAFGCCSSICNPLVKREEEFFSFQEDLHELDIPVRRDAFVLDHLNKNDVKS